MSVLATSDLTKRYGDELVVNHLNLSIAAGDLYGFLGPNGAGKSTTIRMALGLVFPDGGSVEVGGHSVFSSTEARSRALSRVGAVVEEPAFWGYLSGRRNLEYFARAGGNKVDRRARLDDIDEVLRQVGLADAAAKRVKAYSQGMRQRLGIGRALLGHPDLLVLDEPTNGLDPQGMKEVRALLRRLADNGTTVFVSSHLLGEVEAMCDRVGVLVAGKLVAEGQPGHLVDEPDRVRVDVDDRRHALDVLRAVPGISLDELEARSDGGPGPIMVGLANGATPAGVNAALVSAGIGVRALVPEHARLEDVFLTLTEGE